MRRIDKPEIGQNIKDIYCWYTIGVLLSVYKYSMIDDVILRFIVNKNTDSGYW